MKIILIVALLVGVVVLATFVVWPMLQPKNDDNIVYCTQEAMQCPDGSYVSRSGPKCEFAPCPQSAN